MIGDDYLQQGKNQEALNEFNTGLEQLNMYEKSYTKKVKLDFWLHMAITHHVAGNHDKVLQYCECILKDEMVNPYAFFLKGVANLAKKNISDSLYNFNLAQKFYKDSANISKIYENIFELYKKQSPFFAQQLAQTNEIIDL